MDTPAPPIPLDLLTWLESRYPERTPGPTETLDAIRVATGERQVVRFLRFKYEEQNERDLPSQD